MLDAKRFRTSSSNELVAVDFPAEASRQVALADVGGVLRRVALAVGVEQAASVVVVVAAEVVYRANQACDPEFSLTR